MIAKTLLKSTLRVSRCYPLKLNVHYYCTTNLADLKVENVSLTKYIQKLEKEYQTLSETNMASKKSRLLELEPLANILKTRQEILQNIHGLKDLLFDEDPDIRKLAEEERRCFERSVVEVNDEIIEAVLSLGKADEDDINSIVLEVNSGVGGQEAMLFASELFDMYSGFVTYKGWDGETAEYSATDGGGIRHASLLVNGVGAFRHFKHEAGVHRVQRIPATEKSGRIHTSTVSVLALPQPSDIQIDLQEKDLRFETKRATGAGGQHVNTTDSAVRVVHIPSGLAVECQVDRSQIKNRKMAVQRLRALLYQRQLDSQLADLEATKKSQVRSNFRNEKIRTYNFNQDRITDHRLGQNVHNLKAFLTGGDALDVLIRKLDQKGKLDRLRQLVNEVE